MFEHVELKCATCQEMFVANNEQLRKLRRGRTVFVCSLHCRGQLGKKALNVKLGLKPLDAKRLARSRVRGALEIGDIEKPNYCEKCGKEAAVQAHHCSGYEKHLVVQWLCPSCHFLADEAVRRLPGEKNGNSVLREPEVIEIRRLLQSGGSLSALAKKFYVSKKTILLIKHNRTWRHVPCS